MAAELPCPVCGNPVKVGPNGDLRNFNQHVSRCRNKVRCPGCNAEMQRRSLAGHLKKCPLVVGQMPRQKRRKHDLKFVLRKMLEFEQWDGTELAFRKATGLDRQQLARFQAKTEEVRNRITEPTRRELAAASVGSGRKPYVITAEMHRYLMNLIVTARGPRAHRFLIAKNISFIS